jgi:hypothetical protein
MEERTSETVIAKLNELVKSKQPVSPTYWVEAAQFLNLFLADEHEKLFNLQQKVAQAKVDYLNLQCSVAKVKLLVEATDGYREMRNQKAKIGRIEELIRISKLQARLKDTEFKGY